MDTKNSYPRFSEAEYSRRNIAVREAMRTADLSTLIFYSTISSYHEVLYLSNFIATREAFLIFPENGEPTLFIQMFNHVPNARQIANIADLRWGGPDSTTAVIENLRERKLEKSRIGLVGPITFKQYELMRKMLPQVEFTDFTSQFLQLRLIKSEEEIEFQ